jgi:multicomponent Na+:H+ antiporter subunit C
VSAAADLVVPPTVNLVMALTVGGLYAVGFYLLLQRSLMRLLIGVVVLGHGTNLLLQLVGGPPARVPIVGNSPTATFSDPLPQALALTAVVITFALTTFLLALGYRSFGLIGHDEVQDDIEDRRIARGRRSETDLVDGAPSDEASDGPAGDGSAGDAAAERREAGDGAADDGTADDGVADDGAADRAAPGRAARDRAAPEGDR